jgi:hypothetical protein
MKWFALRRFVLATSMLVLGACASDEAREDTKPIANTPVPGEKSSDEPMSATAGPGGAGAGVRW